MEIHADSEVLEVQKLLSSLGWIAGEEVKKIAKAGEGNMNVVLRITTDKRSFILKQSRSYVQKYPGIAAPIERIDVEARFYEALETSAISAHLPNIINYKPDLYLLMIEDLGIVEDLSSIYARRTISEETIGKLIEIAHHTHTSGTTASFPANLELRRLNHQHIYVLPYKKDNGFVLDDVQEGLQDIAAPYQDNPQLSAVIDTMGQEYLSMGTHLIHGDYYPGSWMTIHGQLYVLDPEFAHIGHREFDLGVMGAHIMLSTHDAATIQKLLQLYPDDVSEKKVYQLAGIEIMRRLIGLAQLPLERTLEEKAHLLEVAESWIL